MALFPKQGVVVAGLAAGSALFAAVFLLSNAKPGTEKMAAVATSESLFAAQVQATSSGSVFSGNSKSSLPDGYVLYQNQKYQFSFARPPEARVHTYDEGGGAITVTVEDAKQTYGFQIFVVPYAGTSITEERFRKDVLSGVRTDVANAVIDGVQAVTFKSRDMVLGGTREIWFLRNGYLYEVTALEQAVPWFMTIVGTWKFI